MWLIAMPCGSVIGSKSSKAILCCLWLKTVLNWLSSNDSNFPWQLLLCDWLVVSVEYLYKDLRSLLTCCMVEMGSSWSVEVVQDFFIFGLSSLNLCCVLSSCLAKWRPFINLTFYLTALMPDPIKFVTVMSLCVKLLFKTVLAFSVVFSGRELAFTFAICYRYRRFVCRLSVTLVHPTQPAEIFGNFFHHTIAQGL